MKNNCGRVLFVVALCLFTLAPVVGQDKSQPVMARITVRTDAETRAAVNLGLDLMEYRDGDDLIFMTTRAELDRLAAAGWQVRIDLELTAEMPNGETFMGGYRTVEETFAFLNQMQSTYPHLAQVFTYGQSWLKIQNPNTGYDLTAIRLTSDRYKDFKPTFFLQAGIHARELVPPEMATRFIEYLLSNYGRDGDATWLLDEHQIVVIPIVNPDGRKIAETGQSKRKNMNGTTGGCTIVSRGIDLNRNFSFLWGIINPPTEPPCGETFPGLSAASEPETAAVEDLVDSIYPDQREPDRGAPAPLDATGIFLDMHSTGNLVLYPGGQDFTPPPNIQLRTIARKMASYNGYNPIQSIELYPTSGTAREYGYGERGIAGLAMETGLGSGTCGGFMPQYSCLDGGTNGNFWNLNRPVLLYMSKLARTPYMTSEGPTTETLTVARTEGANSYSFRAQVNDVSNGNNVVTGAEAYVDLPPWRGGVPIPMTAEDGSFNSPNEYAVATIETTPGRHIIYVRGSDANNFGVVKAVFTPAKGVNADFDGDRRTDVSVYRPDTGVWYITPSSNNTFRADQFGLPTDRLVPQDYDGDGKTDLAVYRDGIWYSMRSATGSFSAVSFGVSSDLPVPADYDRDDKADVAVFRDGTWYWLRSTDGGFAAVQFGTAGDRPVAGDYDGDARFDVAVFRPSARTWFILRSSDSGVLSLPFGLSTDMPVQADYDGDGMTNLAVFRPSNGTWYYSRDLIDPSVNFAAIQFGAGFDRPVAGDYDGDGRADVAVYRDGTWYIQQTTAGFSTASFGLASDRPIPGAYKPE